MLGALGLAMASLVASFQDYPGYMDADYYFAGGIQLAEGRGFNEPYLWNYLDDPQALPHPSHSYWMPLASLLAALGMRLTGSTQYASGRLAFIVLAAIVPMVTVRLALTFSKRVFPAVISGLLAVFSIYYVPFLPVPDNYGIYLVLGALFMLAVTWNRRLGNLACGTIAGLMTLARSDGILWLVLGAVAALTGASLPHDSDDKGANETRARPHDDRWLRLCLVLLGFFLVMTPWILRNLEAFGATRAPGAERLLWLTTYDDIFSYPASILTPERWWDQGLPAMVAARFAALRWNLLNTVAAQGGIFLLPFILLGAWEHRRDLRLRLGVGAWLALLGAMTVAVPAVGARGGWFHAGAGLQALWWSLAPLGLERLVAAARRRQLFTPHATYVFGVAMVCVAAVMTAYIILLRLPRGWGEGEDKYPGLEARLVEAGARPQDVVMVRNPPGYYLMTGRSAIVVPYSDSAGMRLAAQQFGAAFLIIEEVGAAGPIRTVYDDLGGEAFEFMGEVDDTRLFRILP